MNNEQKIKLTELIREMGIPANVMGYKYLQDAVEMVIENPSVIYQAMKILYPQVAELNNTTASKVERSIRHGIEISWENCKRNDKIKNIFKVMPESRPVNSQIIATLADTIAKDMY